jgi:hypothetical protein
LADRQLDYHQRLNEISKAAAQLNELEIIVAFMKSLEEGTEDANLLADFAGADQEEEE